MAVGPVYPANLLLAGRPVLVVGGGRVALDKVRGLIEGGADHVTVVAPEVDPALAGLGVTVERRPYEPGEAARYRYVVCAVGDPDVTARVFSDADEAGIFVNAADDPQHCSATLPARVRRGDLLLTVATGGRSPALATWLRRRLEAEYGPEVETLLDLLADVREEIRSRGRSTEGLDWQKALDSGMLEMVREGRVAEAERLLRSCLSSSSE